MKIIRRVCHCNFQPISSKQPNRDVEELYSTMEYASPIAAFHISHNGDPNVKMVTSLGIVAMGPFSRMHLQVHEGT
jgi:hypothetical protein